MNLTAKTSIIIPVCYVIVAPLMMWGDGATRAFPDSASFTAAAALPLHETLFAPRSFFPTLVWRIAGCDEALLVVGNIALSTAAWLCLSLAIAAECASRKGRATALIAVLSFSLTDAPITWHRVLLSESLALSLLALTIAAWLWFWRRQTWWRSLVVLAVTGALVATRDTVAYCIASLCVLLLFAPGRTAPRILLLVGCLALAWVSVRANDISGRWRFPFFNVMGQRILPDNDRVRFFESVGMPVTADLESRAGTWAGDDDRFFYNAPELASFRTWVEAKGRRSLMAFLVCRPAASLRMALEGFPDAMTYNVTGYAPAPFHRTLFGVGWRLLFNRATLPFVMLAGGIAFGWAVASNHRHLLLQIALILAFTSATHYFVAFHGDAMEVGRHCLLAAINTQLALLAVAVASVDIYHIKPTEEA